MNATKRSIFPLLSGLLLFLSWPDRGLNFLVFGALLPWLLVLDDLRSRKEIKRRFLKVFFLSWLLFAVFNGALDGGSAWRTERSGGHGLYRCFVEALLMTLGFGTCRSAKGAVFGHFLLDHPRMDPEQLGHGMALAQARICTGRSGGVDPMVFGDGRLGWQFVDLVGQSFSVRCLAQLDEKANTPPFSSTAPGLSASLFGLSVHLSQLGRKRRGGRSSGGSAQY